ncbi:MAG: hypothetical protein L3K18_09635 [Thermoplasmata archaeon]|nr:hypothetical protein [Thermoplasmata archaeon]
MSGLRIDFSNVPCPVCGVLGKDHRGADHAYEIRIPEHSVSASIRFRLPGVAEKPDAT